MLYSYLHSSNNKRAESLKTMSRPWYHLSPCYYSGTVQVHAFESLVWVAEPTLRTQHSSITWVDAKESRRLRTWASASLKSRKKVAKESQSKHPFKVFFWGTLFFRKLYMKNFKIKNKDNKISHGRGNSLSNKVRGLVEVDSPNKITLEITICEII